MKSHSTLSFDTLGREEAPAGPVRQLFPSVVPPDQIVSYPAWDRALQEVGKAVGRPGIIAIVGPPGIGKTLLLHAIARHLRSGGLVPTLLPPGQLPGPGTPDAILIDDADRLPPNMLHALVRHGQRVVAAGSTVLGDKLAKAGIAELIVHLSPLKREDARTFLAVQIARAGQPSNLIDPAALERLIEAATGVPRTLQMLAGLALFVARLASAPSVTLSHVEQAILIRSGSTADESDEYPAEPEPSDIEGPGPAGSLGFAAAAATPRPLPDSLAAPTVGRPSRPYRLALLGAVAMACIAIGVLGHRLPIAPGRPAGPTLATLPDANPTLASKPEPVQAMPPPPPQLASLQDGSTSTLLLPPAPTFFQSPPHAATAEPPARDSVAVPDPAPSPGPEAPEAAAGPSPAGSLVATDRPLPFPSTVPLHVVLAYDAADRSAERSAASLSETFRRQGLDVSRAAFGPAREAAGVYFYFPEDGPAASTLAGQAGLSAASLHPAKALPRPGTVRVVVTAKTAPRSARANSFSNRE